MWWTEGHSIQHTPPLTPNSRLYLPMNKRRVNTSISLSLSLSISLSVVLCQYGRFPSPLTLYALCNVFSTSYPIVACSVVSNQPKNNPSSLRFVHLVLSSIINHVSECDPSSSSVDLTWPNTVLTCVTLTDKSNPTYPWPNLTSSVVPPKYNHFLVINKQIKAGENIISFARRVNIQITHKSWIFMCHQRRTKRAKAAAAAAASDAKYSWRWRRHQSINRDRSSKLETRVCLPWQQTG